MAKDDYQVLTFKILTYLYVCMKGLKEFDESVFLNDVIGDGIGREYFIFVLVSLNEEGYIQGVKHVKAWGGDTILISDLSNMKITPKGIDFLNNNSAMCKVKRFLQENSISFITSLIELIFKN